MDTKNLEVDIMNDIQKEIYEHFTISKDMIKHDSLFMYGMRYGKTHLTNMIFANWLENRVKGIEG